MERPLLGDKVSALELELEILRERVSRLAVSKLSDPRFPYFEWLVLHEVTPEAQSRLETVLTILSYRVEEVPVPDLLRRPLPEVDLDLLYAEGAPSLDDIVQLLCGVLAIGSPAVVRRLLCALRDQGMFEDLVEALMDD